MSPPQMFLLKYCEDINYKRLKLLVAVHQFFADILLGEKWLCKTRSKSKRDILKCRFFGNNQPLK